MRAYYRKDMFFAKALYDCKKKFEMNQKTQSQ